MKQFEFTQDHEGKKKGDVIEIDLPNYHGYQHPLIMRGILRAVHNDRYSQLKAMNKEQQSKLIRTLGGEDVKIPSTEDDRIKLIIKLEG